MASSSGTSSGSSQLPNSGSEEDLQALMHQRKQKRMLSNRESARRSRMRKQKHLDDLMAQVGHLRKENSQILTALNITTQNYLDVEAQNSVLRTQMMELNARLQSLDEILCYMNGGGNDGFGFGLLSNVLDVTDDGFMRPWSLMAGSCQPIMASADMFQYR
ncbi:LOW QUALITY PROTEIN: bZIP transcription factor 11-like [Phoenix dactylifera]|uniref:LOW QUALITY PROTEIN: bZIP transcription factor 11-like n=1 Tax=Phoenix dactylifera TaxID=42345 RepID=A0A8B7BTC4_PHODC|nr:LOW QUALITY PROTEIN: bZIP transcription factor 11-like [Phoenix dactylifera]